MSTEVPPPQNCYTQWFGTFACSIISIVALTSGFGASVSAQNGKNTWAFSAFIISMIISFFAVLAHMVKTEFSGTTAEAGMVRICMELEWTNSSIVRRHVRQCTDSRLSRFSFQNTGCCCLDLHDMLTSHHNGETSIIACCFANNSRKRATHTLMLFSCRIQRMVLPSWGMERLAMQISSSSVGQLLSWPSLCSCTS
jgi:hypothetical protein